MLASPTGPAPTTTAAVRPSMLLSMTEPSAAGLRYLPTRQLLAVLAVFGLVLAACVDDATTAGGDDAEVTEDEGTDSEDESTEDQGSEEVDADGQDDDDDATASGPLPAGAVADPASLAALTPGACAFDSLVPLSVEPECYSMSVPEDWQDPDPDDQVILEVAVFTGDGSEENPIIYFDGGPGGHTLDNLSFTFPQLVQPFLGTRDFIVFDQRGLGLSQPVLDCPEMTEVILADLTGEIDAEGLSPALLGARDGCRDRLLESGVNLEAYNSIASANDVEAMRALLGYEELNVIGTSYGTRLGQTYLRMYPASARSMVLDSVFPTAADLWSNVNQGAERAFVQLLDGCAAAPECSERFPDFEQNLFQLLDQLDAEPAEVQLRHQLQGTEIEATYDGDDALSLFFSALYNRTQFSAIPQLVEDGLAGDYSGLETFGSISLTSLDLVSQGMQLSVECNEEIQFESVEVLESYVPADPRFGRLVEIESDEANLFALCEGWPAGQAPDVEAETVQSDVPTLVLAGQYDPITPPAGADVVQEGLSNSYSVLFPNEGHGLVVTPCGAEIVNSFIEDPSSEPATTCLADSPEPAWDPTFDPSAIELVPFESTGLINVSGVRPEGWIDAGNGAFARQQTGLDPTVLVVLPTTGLPAENLAQLMSAQLGAELLPGDPIQVDGEAWEFYSTPAVDPQAVRMAVSPGDSGTIVLLAAEPDEMDALFDALFLPVAEAATAG